jgi:hypothetical protein
VVDPAKPTITITHPSAGIVTNDSSLAVIGTVSGNATSANLILNGAAQSVSVAGGGFSANVILAEGMNIVVANAYTAGHEGESDYLGTSGVTIVTLDTTAPTVIIDYPVSDSVVSSAGCEVSGTIDDPSVSTANLTLNGASQSIPVLGGVFTQYVTLASRNNTITVTAADEMGNVSADDPVTVMCDNTKPEVTITSPVNNMVTNVYSQIVTGTVNDSTITTATLYVNNAPQTLPMPVSPDGSFSTNVTLTTGANTLEVSVTDSANITGTSGVVNVTLDNTAPTITLGLKDPTDSIAITVTSDEALAATPTVSVNSALAMTQIGVNKWSGTYGSIASPIAAGQYIVTANATDKAGNTTTRTASFCKQIVTISENETATILTDSATLQISTTANVTDASVSVTHHLADPSGNVGNPEDAEVAIGVFLEIVVSPELRDSLESVYIRVDYEPGELPPDTDESTLKLYLWDVSSGTWEPVPGSGVNTDENYIYGTVTHLSRYGGFGSTAAPSGPSFGWGGGFLLITVVSTSGFNSEVPLTVDAMGIVQADCQLRCIDETVWLDITKTTKLLDAQGKALGSLSVELATSPPAPPTERAIIYAYDFQPDGAAFEPPITLTMTFDPETLPSGIAEDELYIAYRDGSQWLALKSIMDTEANRVSAAISHFTQYALISKLPLPAPKPTTVPTYAPPSVPEAAPAPASFAISDLLITPSEVEPAEQVTILPFISW